MTLAPSHFAAKQIRSGCFGFSYPGTVFNSLDPACRGSRKRSTIAAVPPAVIMPE